MTAYAIAQQLVNGNISTAAKAIVREPITGYGVALLTLDVIDALVAEHDYTWDNAVTTVRRCLQGRPS